VITLNKVESIPPFSDLLVDWNFRFYLVLAIQFLTILLIIIIHSLHHWRSHRNHNGIKELAKEVKDAKEDIEKINKELLPYLDNLSRQRDKYKSRLKSDEETSKKNN